MSLGNVLIRPQQLDRRASDSDAQVVDLLTALASRLLEDFLRGGPASEKIAAACQARVVVFVQQFEPRLGAVGHKLEDWLKPYLDIIKAAPTPTTSVEGLTKTAEFVFKLTYKIIEDVHSTALVGRLNELADILENDLGVSRDGFENLFSDMLDHIEEALKQEFLNGLQSDVSVNNFLLSVQIRGARRHIRRLFAQSPIPDLNIRAMIRDAQLRLIASGWDEKLDNAKNSLTEIEHKIPEILPTLTDVLSFNVSTELMARDIGVDIKEYAWYASWFTGEQVAAVDRLSYAGWENEDKIKFGVFPLPMLEYWVAVTTILEEGLKAVFNGTHIDKNNWASPLFNTIGQGAMGIFSLVSILVENKDWANFMKIKEATWFKKLAITEGIPLLSSIRTGHGFRGWLWALYLNDRSEATSPNDILEWGSTINKALLSIMTLINNNPDVEQAENHNKVDGFAELGRKIAAHFIAQTLGDTEWHQPASLKSAKWIGSYLIGGGVVFGANLTAWLLGAALARRISTEYWTKFDVLNILGGESAYGGLVYSFIDFHGDFSGLEGETDGGKYGLKTQTLPNSDIAKSRAEFGGYPPRSTSPYKLPFAHTEGAIFCSQTHRGLSAHNYHSGLIYAVDFLYEKDKVVLAMRGGVVEDYNDRREDASKNYIVIRHDEVNAAHDKTEFGHRAVTFARYENSDRGGIQRAFSAMGISSTRIVGTRVPQGAPIMIMGERDGVFSFEHLQVYVGAPGEGGVAYPTIPFVFQDILTEGGVPKNGQYYESSNISTLASGSAVKRSAFHPDKTAGFIQASGADYVILDNTASNATDFYKEAFIFLSYTLPEGDTAYEYKKIAEYVGNERKVIISDAWIFDEPPPINGATAYRIGVKTFPLSDAFDRSYAFLARRNVQGHAVNLDDNTPPFLLMNQQNYHAPVATGLIVGGGAVGTNVVHLDVAASDTEGAYFQQHILILRNDLPFQYRLILAYKIELGVKKVIIEGTWDESLQTAGTPDRYMIGSKSYPNVPLIEHNNVFLANDTREDAYLPEPFRDERLPYSYTFPLP